MKTLQIVILIGLSITLMHMESLQSQNLNYALIDSLDHLCLRFNEQVDSIYNGKGREICMDTLIISEYQNKIKKLIDTCKVYKNNLIFFPLQSYFTNSRQYLTRLKEFSNNPYVSIAPFQYNELKFQYAQMEICRNTLASAISYSGMMKEMDKSIKVLDSLKTHIDTTLQTIQVKMDTNFKNINTSVDTLNLKAIKIDQAVKKNKNKLNWTLGITTATGVVAIAILLITLLH